MRRRESTITREPAPLRICVVGSGTRFLGGVSYYTLRLANALAVRHRVSVVLMRQILPTGLFPGRKRVGDKLTDLAYDPRIHRFDGVDWYWLPSMLGAILFLFRERPKIVLFQWWSGTVLHSYLLLALMSKLLGAHVVIEFHEVLDPGEANMPLVRVYVRALSPFVIRLANAFVVHSNYDRVLLGKSYKLGPVPSLRSRTAPMISTCERHPRPISLSPPLRRRSLRTSATSCSLA